MSEGAIDTQNKPITSEQIKEVSVSVFPPPASSATCLQTGDAGTLAEGVWHDALLF